VTWTISRRAYVATSDQPKPKPPSSTPMLLVTAHVRGHRANRLPPATLNSTPKKTPTHDRMRLVNKPIRQADAKAIEAHPCARTPGDVVGRGIRESSMPRRPSCQPDWLNSCKPRRTLTTPWWRWDYERRRTGVRVRFSFFSLISYSSLTGTSMSMTLRAADIRVRLDRLGTLLPFST
jgi:hypothetical protein